MLRLKSCNDLVTAIFETVIQFHYFFSYCATLINNNNKKKSQTSYKPLDCPVKSTMSVAGLGLKLRGFGLRMGGFEAWGGFVDM